MSAHLLIQTSAAATAELEQMSTALIIISVGAVLFGLMCLGILIAGFRLMRSITGLVKKVEQQIDQLAPRAGPLVDRVTNLATDARDVTDTVRRRVTDLMDTVEQVNQSLKTASRAAELRVRDFVAVLDVVKAEAEEVLIDTAATARGIHRTAEALRQPALPPHALPVVEEETDRVVRRARTRPRTPAASPTSSGDGTEGEGS
jgi:methyl-accepting chemotaxis protein